MVGTKREKEPEGLCVVFRMEGENDAARCYNKEITVPVSFGRKIMLSHLSLCLELLTKPGIYLLGMECLRHTRNEVT